MRAELMQLIQLQSHPGYKQLESIWMEKVSEIEEKRDSVASRNGQYSQDSWKYQAGIEKGFKMAMLTLKFALIEMEQEHENETAEGKYNAIVQNLKGEQS